MSSPTTLGPWVVERELGAGAMGAVFRCHSADDPTRIAAVKVMAPELASSKPSRDRFLREAKALSRVEHPNCCRAYSYGDDEEPWLALEFIEGRPLDEVLKARGHLEPVEALGLARDMLAGLGAAHAAGVIHRDVKPANMILRADGSLVLVDFGLARRDDDSMLLTVEGSIMGTPHYMSPEQAGGKTPDGRGDLYAVGATLYHLLSGRPVFRGRSAAEVVMKHLSTPPPKLSAVRAGIPRAVEGYVDRLLRKSPDDRFPDAGSALRALERVERKLLAPEPPPRPATPATPAAPPALAKVPPLVAPPPAAPPAAAVTGSAAPLVWAIGGALLGALLVGSLTTWVAGLGAGLALGGGIALWLREGTVAPPSLRERAQAARARVAQDPLGAAQLFADIGLWADAGRAFVAGGDPGRAAAAYAKAGDHERAVPLFEEAGDLPRALEAARGIGDVERTADLLERCHRPEEAANLLSERLAELEARRKRERLVTRLADLDESIGRIGTSASRLLEEVGRPREAAVLLERIGERERAAELFLRAGDRDAAAHAFLEAGKRERAIEIYARAGDALSAARLRADARVEAGDLDGALETLLVAGDLTRAAEMAAAAGDRRQAGELLERAGKLTLAAEHFDAAGEGARAADLLRAAEQAEHTADPTEPARGARTEAIDLSAPPENLAGHTIDRYQLSSSLGSGAFATVYGAEHVLLGRRAAIKVLHPRLAADAGVAERFLQEAQVVARLRHPGVVQVYEFGPYRGTLFLAMEEVRGRTLRAVSDEGRLAATESLRIACGLLGVLQAAHEAGVVHRDVKPENVMLDERGEVRVLDFGMARVFWNLPLVDQGSATVFQGTPRYTSPEAARGEPVDARSDQYSAAVLLYELLAGRPPYTGASPMALLTQHASAEPEPLVEASPPVAAAVARALSKDPAERFESCGAFAAALSTPTDSPSAH